MLSLKECIEWLERDLTAQPMRISAYSDMPFAILQYSPREEWTLRQEMRHLATRLEERGKKTYWVSLAEMLWESIKDCEGLDVLVRMEKQQGFIAAEEQVTTYLSHPSWKPLATTLAQRIKQYDPATSIIMLYRAAALAPEIYYLSKLLDEIHGKANTPTILLYPGSLEGTQGLRFMDLPDREALGNYRVKIYGQSNL